MPAKRTKLEKNIQELKQFQEDLNQMHVWINNFHLDSLRNYSKQSATNIPKSSTPSPSASNNNLFNSNVSIYLF